MQQMMCPKGQGQMRQYQQPVPQRPYRDHDSDEYPVYGVEHGHHGRRKKRGGFLGELFD